MVKELNNITAENKHQTATLEKGENDISYISSGELDYTDIIAMGKGLNVISEFFDVNAAAIINKANISAVALGKSLEDALQKAIDSNPIDYMNSVLVVSSEVNSDIAKLLENTNKIAAPKFTPNAEELLAKKGVTYVKINTPLKDYKKFLSESIKITPFGILKQTPNMSELNKDTFKILSKTKPTVEQIEDAVFAWKISKHANSRAIVIAKDLCTVAISQGLGASSAEYALDFSCDSSKDAIMAMDLPAAIHDINVAAQGRISTIIAPSAAADVINMADKYNMVLITTGITNALYS